MRNAGTWIALIAALAIQTKGCRRRKPIEASGLSLKSAAHPMIGTTMRIRNRWSRTSLPASERSTGRTLGSVSPPPRETDIEHIVPLSEAHDSGLCSASATTKARFARDVLNLTLASPQSEPVRERREGRRPVAASAQRVLVRK